MSNNREGYRFSLETKEEIKEFQKGICPGCGKKCKLTNHHKIPIWFARKYLQPTQEVKDYISQKGNDLGLCRQCHDKVEETIGEDLEIMKEVIIYVLGSEVLK